MKLFKFYLGKDQRIYLEKISKKTMAPIAALIRKAIDEFLERNRNELR